MKFDLRQLKRNKPLLYGMGAAGVLGLATLYRRKKGGGGGDTATTAVSPVASYGGAPRYDSTGTDVANFLGHQNEYLQNAVTDWQKQITDALGNLGGNGGQGAPATGPLYATVQPGWKVNQWIRDLQAGYGAGADLKTRGGGVTYDQLVALNPSLNQNISWAGGNNDLNTFKAPITLRIA